MVGPGLVAAVEVATKCDRVLAPTPTAPPLALACRTIGPGSLLKISKHLLKHLPNK